MNFQMFKLVLEKAEEPEIKLPTSAGSSKKQERVDVIDQNLYINNFRDKISKILLIAKYYYSGH